MCDVSTPGRTKVILKIFLKTRQTFQGKRIDAAYCTPACKQRAYRHRKFQACHIVTSRDFDMQ
jgi:hypothetical protein